MSECSSAHKARLIRTTVSGTILCEFCEKLIFKGLDLVCNANTARVQDFNPICDLSVESNHHCMSSSFSSSES